MERTFHKSRSFKDAEEWDILQNVRMTPEERQAVASEIKKRVYGKEAPDVREVHRFRGRRKRRNGVYRHEINEK